MFNTNGANYLNIHDALFYKKKENDANSMIFSWWCCFE